MRLLNCLAAALLLANTLPACLGQDYAESENWIGVIEGGTPSFLFHVYKNYDEADVANARKKLEAIQKQPPSKDEWAGTYNLYGELSDTKMLWTPTIGFVNYYVYTCAIELRSLNYGRVLEDTAFVTLISDKPSPPYAFMDSGNSQKFVKVKWGDRRYLVKEKDLLSFAELAAGYWGSGMSQGMTVSGEKYATDVNIWNSTWTKADDRDKNAFGLPEFPSQYKHLLRKPISGKITKLGRYEKDPITEDPVMTYSRQYVSLNIGSNNGVRPEMEFYVEGVHDRVRVVSVSHTSSVAVLERWLDSETRKDMCTREGEEVPCLSVKVGMTAKTIPDDFLDG